MLRVDAVTDARQEICDRVGQAHVNSTPYHLDLVTPGISPVRERLRKQMRQSWNFLRYPLGRPQRWQRLCARTLNLGLRRAFAIMHVFATFAPFDLKFQIARHWPFLAKGIPSAF